MGTKQEKMLLEVMARDCAALQAERHRQEYGVDGEPGDVTRPSTMTRRQMAAVVRQRRERALTRQGQP
jgi:hypothetical protein